MAALKPALPAAVLNVDGEMFQSNGRRANRGPRQECDLGARTRTTGIEGFHFYSFSLLVVQMGQSMG
jgi:hypothetical protein